MAEAKDDFLGRFPQNALPCSREPSRGLRQACRFNGIRELARGDNTTFKTRSQCPAVQTLTARPLHPQKRTWEDHRPKGVGAGCALRRQGTRSKTGRTLHRHEHQTLRERARTAGSAAHFSRTFGELTSRSRQQYVLHYRLEQDRALLADGTLRVATVAQQCGFGSAAHCARQCSRSVASNGPLPAGTVNRPANECRPRFWLPWRSTRRFRHSGTQPRRSRTRDCSRAADGAGPTGIWLGRRGRRRFRGPARGSSGSRA